MPRSSPQDLFPGFLETPEVYAAAQAYWQHLWASLAPGEGWSLGWLNTTMKDGTPNMDGDGIFSALHLDQRRALKVIQRPALQAHEVATWTSRFEVDGVEVGLTVLAGPLTDATEDGFRSLLAAFVDASDSDSGA